MEYVHQVYIVIHLYPMTQEALVIIQVFIDYFFIPHSIMKVISLSIVSFLSMNYKISLMPLLKIFYPKHS